MINRTLTSEEIDSAIEQIDRAQNIIAAMSHTINELSLFLELQQKSEDDSTTE